MDSHPDGFGKEPVSAASSPSTLFNALADPVRCAMMERLAQHGPMTVGDLSEPFAVSAPAISRHLGILETAGVLERTVDRQFRVCSVQPEALREVAVWIERVCSVAQSPQDPASINTHFAD